ncbi:hypothetical protein [Nocardia gipuzkoensis]
MAGFEKLDYFRGHSPGLESCQLFGAFLVVRLACLAGFFARLLPHLTCLLCYTLQAGSVGRLSGRRFPSVDGFPYLELTGHREFQRHPFGGRPFNPPTLIGSACLPGSLGFFSGLPITFDLLRGVRAATCSGFPELLHLPEFSARSWARTMMRIFASRSRARSATLKAQQGLNKPREDHAGDLIPRARRRSAPAEGTSAVEWRSRRSR